MKTKPTCAKCGGQHWNYVACEQAPEANAAEQAAAKLRALAEAETTARLGHVNQFAGFKSDKYNVTGGGDQPIVRWLKREDGRGNRWRAG